MGMEIKYHLHVVFFYHLLHAVYYRLVYAGWFCPFSVGIVAAQISSGVAVDYPVDVDHGHNSENIVVHEIVSFWGI